MTFWGFLFMLLIVFVAFYAWYRFARRGVNAPHLSGDRHTDIRRANQPLMAETGTIGERPKLKSMRPKRHRSVEVQKYLTEVGTIGDAPQAQRRQIAGYLPAPKQDFSTEAGTIGDVQASSTSHAIASETISSNLSQAQLNPNHDPSEWLENSDLERLNNQAAQKEHAYRATNATGQQANDRVELMQQLQNNSELLKSEKEARGASNATTSMQITDPLTQSNQQSAAYESTASGAPSGQSQSYMQATQDFSTEAGLIGDVTASATYPDQARLGNMRRGYVHQPDMEIGMLDNDSMLAKFPDQLPTLNPKSFKDPDCK